VNPYPCGYYTDPYKECSCTSQNIQKYLSRVSGPLLDRIDIQIEVPAVQYKELASGYSGENSECIRERVQKAREVQLSRFSDREKLYCNADMQSRDIRDYCQLDKLSEELLKKAITQLGLSARAYDRILKVSRTIADLSSDVNIKPQNISEAIQYRSLDRQLWL
jgi:magnesium chelatase family protein